ncbi:hypothetical protein [Azospirillum thermophilum]|uniref:Uncharacterized protein n=1 Tax=Azospirillum thermophilum TaxID=2202148 RepID=A0A2S2D0N9_9PROT|nr:hypothetical protein [Azospirillum thermophilum]AWK90324.1 hypothetical protein DEW08_30375 [Azospirillum thermophilum]
MRLFLRARFRGPRAKNVAAAFGISVPLAYRLLQGYAPRMWLFEEMVAQFGSDFLRAVFAEAFAAEDARLQQLEDEVRSLRTQLSAARTPSGFGEEGAAAPAISTRMSALVASLVATIPCSVRAGEPA